MPRRKRERGACQDRHRRVAGAGDWEHVTGRLVPGWEERARETRAFARRREIDGPGALLRLVLLAATQGWDRRLVAWWAGLAGLGHLSGVAVGKRVRQARAWLGLEVGLLLGLRRARWAGRAVRVRLVDATVIRAPGPGTVDWRAHAVLDLEAGALCGLELTDARGAERLTRHPLAPADVAVADRVHARRTDLGLLLPLGQDLVVRIGWRGLPLETPAGDPLDLCAWLRSPLAAPAERTALVRTGTGAHRLRLVAAPLPPREAAEARRRCRQRAKKQGRAIDPRTVLAAGFVLLVTTLDRATWPLADVLTLYRCRWQIELLFKRLKSLWHLDRLRARNPEAAQAHLLAVILAALLAGEVARDSPIPLDAWLDDRHRPLSRWRWEAVWHHATLNAIRGPFDLAVVLASLTTARRFLCDSPRRRRLQAAHARHFLRSHAVHQEQRCA